MYLIFGMIKSRPIFQSFAVTKPVVTQTAHGYQMKDLDTHDLMKESSENCLEKNFGLGFFFLC